MLCARRPICSAIRLQSWTPSRLPASLQRRNLLTLAIETSCDDTAVAILEKKSSPDGRPVSYASEDWLTPSAKLLFNEKITARNTGLGGIHPIEALESHQEHLAKLVSRALQHLPEPSSSTSSVRTIDLGNGTSKVLPDFISVTRGPGMRSNLLCGLNTAKGLAVAWQVPLLGVHHMQAHALTPRLVHALEHHGNDNDNSSSPQISYSPDFPFLTLLLSGGHTLLLNSSSLTQHALLAATHDIAIGDALDKLGRLLLPPHLRSSIKDTAYARHLSSYAFPDRETYDRYPIPRTRAEEVDKVPSEFGWSVPVPLANTKELGFSFSGIVSYISQVFEKRCAGSTSGDAESGSGKRGISDEERLSLARAALGTSFEHISSRLLIALEQHRTRSRKTGASEIQTLVVSGGVASNDYLRWYLRKMLDVRGFGGVKLEFPPVELCTDNAAMIGWAGCEMFEGGYRSGLGTGVRRKWGMDRIVEDGEYEGLGDWWEG